MAVRAVVFDVGETLIDESGMWERAADVASVPRFTLMGVLGGLAARGEHHVRIWEILGVEPPATAWTEDDFYPDALPCLDRLRAAGLRVGAVGNTPEETEELLRAHVDFVGSSGRWGIKKPSAAFFDRIATDARVDNDIEPALAAGMTAIHVRRGPWGHLYEPPAAAIRIRSLDELPGALGG